MCLLATSTFLIVPPRYFLVAQTIWVCTAFGLALGTKKLKERVTSPRGGYVGFDEQAKTIRGHIPYRALNIGLMFMIVCIISVFRDLIVFPASEVAAVSVGFMGAYIFEGLKYRIGYMLWLAAFSVAVGVWAYVRNDHLAFVVFWQGAALAAIGGSKLWRFVKSHPKPIDDAI